ncbi:MAG: metalloregulator ArsR/SmtB family transcription factor [Deltaproteobacteria bacterium]|nr:metalloregulator ArsR/SmtB family transcription factor [Deltaproteobacteria bacterium]
MEIAGSIKIMKALSDPSRLMVMNSLMEKSQYVEELSERLDLAPSTISFHLKKLEEANLVTREKAQYYVVFHANHSIFSMTLNDLTRFNNIEKFIQEERIEQYREKVIRTFFKKNKLVQIPAQYKKRLIILEEILKRFQPGKRYSEQEVNDIISQIYDDHCLIRREMIDANMMMRENNEYWLAEPIKRH